MATHCDAREATAKSVNQALKRLPLILDILKEASGKAIGDSELRQGAKSAANALLLYLRKLPIAPSSRDFESGPEEDHATTWFDSNEIEILLPNIGDFRGELTRILPINPNRQ